MMATVSTSSSKRTQAIICLSSDEDSEPQPESESESESELESDLEYEDESEFEDDSEFEEKSNEESDRDDEYDDSKGKNTDEERYKRVVHLIQDGKSLDVLRLEDWKAYLRKHELRISGTKATCIKRILEHWRIKDGNGERLYPKSSFIINCTGDVCRDDIVLFKQKVYQKYDKIKRGGGAKVIGKRTIAGRVVKESYGKSKQQHTFTIEVLWSQGTKPLPSLYPLLVKGRNLYKLSTFRQPWTNEAARTRVLAEKHSRGAIARYVKVTRRSKLLSGNKGSKRKNGSSMIETSPNKKRRKEAEFTSRKNKPKHQHKKISPHNDKKKKRGTKTNPAKARNTHPNAREAATREHSETNTYFHPNANDQRHHPYMHTHHYDNYSHTPANSLHRIQYIPRSYTLGHMSADIFHRPQRTPTSYNAEYNSSYGHVPHHNMDYSSHMHNECYINRPHRSAYQLDSRMQSVFDPRVSDNGLQRMRRY